MGDDAFQLPFPAGHNLLDIPHILRHIAAGADNTLLGIGHVQQVNGAGRIVDSYRDEAAFDFSKTQEVAQDALRTGSVQPAVNIGGLTTQ